MQFQKPIEGGSPSAHTMGVASADNSVNTSDGPYTDEAATDATLLLDPEAITPESRAKRNHLFLGLLFSVVGAVLFAGKAILAKLMYQQGADAVLVITLRMSMALPFFVFIAWWGGRDRPRLTLRDWAGIMALGFSGYYVSMYCDFIGLQYIGVNLERMILYLGPTIVLLINRFMFGRPVSLRQVSAVAIAYIGVLIVFGSETVEQGDYVAFGSLLVFISGALYATTLVYANEMIQRVGAIRLAGSASMFASFFIVITFVIVRPVEQIVAPAPILWMSLGNAVLCTALAHVMIMIGLERIGPVLAGQIGVLGPLSTIFLSIIVLGEKFTAYLGIGTAFVIVGIWLLTRWRDPPVAAKPE